MSSSTQHPVFEVHPYCRVDGDRLLPGAEGLSVSRQATFCWSVHPLTAGHPGCSHFGAVLAGLSPAGGEAGSLLPCWLLFRVTSKPRGRTTGDRTKGRSWSHTRVSHSHTGAPLGARTFWVSEESGLLLGTSCLGGSDLMWGAGNSP